MAPPEGFEGEVAHRRPGHWFEPMAAHMGEAYLRYSFTKGTEQEVGFLVDVLGLRPGMRVLDVGCGPGRHALALAAQGIEVVGVDISEPFVRLGREEAASAGVPARFVRGDARRLPVRPGSFDAAISLCQGGFGLVGDDDPAVLDGLAAAVRPGGLVALSAFSAYFAVRHLEEGDAFDASAGVNHEVAALRSPSGEERSFDLWTSCFTPRELRLLVDRSGLELRHLWAVAPGAYRPDPPDVDHPEHLVVAARPGGTLDR